MCASWCSVAAAVALFVCSNACAVPNPPRAASHTVMIEGAAFTPASLIVKAGDTVTWINRDPFPHTVSSRAAPFDSGTLQHDASWQLSPALPGEFSYTCELHRPMQGTLRVE